MFFRRYYENQGWEYDTPDRKANVTTLVNLAVACGETGKLKKPKLPIKITALVNYRYTIRLRES